MGIFLTNQKPNNSFQHFLSQKPVNSRTQRWIVGKRGKGRLENQVGQKTTEMAFAILCVFRFSKNAVHFV